MNFLWPVATLFEVFKMVEIASEASGPQKTKKRLGGNFKFSGCGQAKEKSANQSADQYTESFLIWLVRRCHVGKTSAAGGTSAARRGVVKSSAARGVGPGGGAVGSIISKRSCSVFICCR